VSCPIGVLNLGSTVMRSQNGTAAAIFAAAISLNLAFINALPVPSLDGGQLVRGVRGGYWESGRQEETGRPQLGGAFRGTAADVVHVHWRLE